MNKEVLKCVSSQEVNSLVCTPRTQTASGYRWRERLQNSELRSKTSQLEKVWELASFWHTTEIGKCYTTIPAMDDGFGDSLPVCREYALLRADPQSRVFAAISGRTLSGPVIEVHVAQLLGNHGFEIKIQSPNDPDRTSWVLICRGKNRYVDELHTPDSGHNLTCSELLSEQAVGEESETCETEVEPNSTGASRAKTILDAFRASVLYERNHTYEGSGNLFVLVHLSKEELFQQRSRNWS